MSSRPAWTVYKASSWSMWAAECAHIFTKTKKLRKENSQLYPNPSLQFIFKNVVGGTTEKVRVMVAAVFPNAQRLLNKCMYS